MHKELHEKGIIKGIEVVNGRYNIIAHRIAEKYNLTLLGNSDAHADVFYTYRTSHRPVTLAFVKDKTEEGVKEALKKKRTAVYVDDFIIARYPEADALFKASLETSFEKRVRNGEPILSVTIINKSDVPYSIRMTAPYNIENYPLGQMILKPHEPRTFVVKEMWDNPSLIELDVEVYNVVVSPEQNLRTKIQLQL